MPTTLHTGSDILRTADGMPAGYRVISEAEQVAAQLTDHSR